MNIVRAALSAISRRIAVTPPLTLAIDTCPGSFARAHRTLRAANCGENTFVVDDVASSCYSCTHSEPVVECTQCSRLNFENDMLSFFGSLDTDYDEGITRVHNSYGYSNYSACPNCISRIKENVQDQRSQEEFHRLEEEYYRRDARFQA